MEVKVYDEDNKLLWSINRKGKTMSGVTCAKYVADGTQQKIINVLKSALSQAEGELLVSDNAD